MATDPRIPLAVQVPQISQSIDIFENALLNQQTRDIRQAQEQRTQTTFDQEQELFRENQIIKSVSDFSPTLKPLLEQAIQTGDTNAAQTALTQRLIQLQRAGTPTDETVDALIQLRNNNPQQVLSDLNTATNIAQQRFGPKVSAGQSEFENLLRLAKGAPESIEAQSARVALGLDPRASLSAIERIATTPGLTPQVAVSQAEIEGAKAAATEGEKLKKQKKFKPEIAKAVKLATAKAAEKGEVLTDLARMEASLPGVREVVDELIELSAISTSTFAGRLFDTAVKESGFGSTKGANAQAKMVAIVNNQVLPLLRETFGAAFTAAEGESLRKSLVDVNASPDQKRAQLEAFLAQKERNVRTKQAQLGQSNQVVTDEFSGFKVVR